MKLIFILNFNLSLNDFNKYILTTCIYTYQQMPVQQTQEQRGISWLRLEMTTVQHTFDRTI